VDVRICATPDIVNVQQARENAMASAETDHHAP